jgi:hypothetical protein
LQNPGHPQPIENISLDAPGVGAAWRQAIASDLRLVTSGQVSDYFAHRYRMVIVDRAVFRRWVSVAVTAAAHATRDEGGRPPTYDWIAFDAEVVRMGNTPDGLPSRRELMHHMGEWCVATWGHQPAESMLRDRIRRLYPRAK